MNEEFVTKKEFDNLKEEVKEIKQEMVENQKLLQNIDKKLDVINSKVTTSETIEDLKIAPLKKRVENLEQNQDWIRKAVISSIISIVVGAVVFVVKMM
jgi:predicted  nucleic acid-binding Zn-ribbon protein